MTKISCGQLPSKHRDEGHFAQLKGGACNQTAQRCEVVFVTMTRFFDEAMFAQTANNGGDLAGVFTGQMFADVGVFESADHKFAAKDNAEQIEVAAVEHVESAVGAVVGTHGFGHFVEPFDAVGGIVYGAEEVDVSAVGVMQEFGEVFEAVDAFLHRRELEAGASVAVCYLAVVFEKREVGGGRLNAQHDAVFIVHFYRGLSHVVSNTGALDAGVEIVAHLVLVVSVELASEKGGNVVGFDGVSGGANQFLVKRGKVLLALEYDVGGVFGLHEAPMNESYGFGAPYRVREAKESCAAKEMGL